MPYIEIYEYLKHDTLSEYEQIMLLSETKMNILYIFAIMDRKDTTEYVLKEIWKRYGLDSDVRYKVAHHQNYPKDLKMQYMLEQ